MKKILILLIITTILFTACSTSSSNRTMTDSANTGKVESNGSQTASLENWNKLSMNWNSRNGVYSIIEPDKLASGGKATMTAITSSSYLLFTFFDNKNLNSTVLCNKPNCKHNSSTCNAYCSMKNALPNKSFLFGLDDKIYFIAQGVVYVMNEDGTKRSKIMELPQRYTSQSTKITAFLIGDKVYLETDYVKDNKDGDFSDHDNRRTILFVIDVREKTYKQLYEYNTMESSEFLGIIGDKAYYLYQDDYTKLEHHTQAEVDAQENGRNTRIFSRNISNGNKTDIFSGKSNEYDQVILRENYIFYQNRKNHEIIRYNPANGEKKVLVANINTYIKFLPMDIQDNKLFYTIDYYNSDFKNKKPTDNESYYVDIKTGENTKIGYRIPCNNGEKQIFSGFTKETPDYYILPMKYEIGIEKGEGGSIGYEYIKSTCYGKIKKQDFLKGKYDVQEISWKGDKLQQ